MNGRREEEGGWIRQLRSLALKELDSKLDLCEANNENDRMVIEKCASDMERVRSEDGVPALIDYLIKKASQDANVPAAVLLNTFIANSGVSLADQAKVVLPGLLNLYTSTNTQIVDHSIGATAALIQSMGQKEMITVLPVMNSTIDQMVATAGGKGQHIPGFKHSNGLTPLITIIQNTITAKKKEISGMAIETLKLVVELAEISTLENVFRAATIPLIQVYRDDLSVNDKSKILKSMGIIFSKLIQTSHVSNPFLLPHIESMFFKALQDQSSSVRLAGGSAFVRLMKFHPKPEATMTELLRLATSEDQNLIESSLATARALFAARPDEMSDVTFEEILFLTEEIYAKPVADPSEIDNSLTFCSGALLGEMVMQKRDWRTMFCLLRDVISPEPRRRQAMGYVLQFCSMKADVIWSSDLGEKFLEAHEKALTSNDPIVVLCALRAASFILQKTIDTDFLSAVVRYMKHENSDVRQMTAISLGHFLYERDVPVDLLKGVVPQLIKGTSDRNHAVRKSSQLALIHGLKLTENRIRYDEYRTAVDLIEQGHLDEIRVNMSSRISARNVALEPLDTITTVD